MDIRVLHVDDEPDFADLTATFLERESGRIGVETAVSAGDGLACLAETQYDCIVSDYDMPGTDGIEFLEAVREEYPDIPFILFTGKGSEEVASDAIAAGTTDYLQKRTGTDQYELLANRILNVVAQSRAQQRADNLDRIRTLRNNINQALVRSDSRAEVERRICEIISQSDPYLFAWIGEVDPDTDRVTPRAWAGIGEAYLDDITVTADDSPTGQGPGGTAIRERRVAVSQNLQADTAMEPWRVDALEQGYQAIAAVPLAYEDTLYGLLSVYADRPEAFDDDERQLLTELGTDITHAIHSLDVTAQVRRERDRRQALFDNAPAPVVAAEVRDDGDIVITAANDEFNDVFGFDSGEIVGEDPADSIVPTDGMDAHERFRQRAKAGETITTEVERMTTDGPRPFLMHIIPFSEGGEQVTGMYVWYTDISTRTERQLQRYKTVVEASGDPVYTLDADGTFSFLNDAFCEMTGYDEDQLLGAHFASLLAQSDRLRGESIIRSVWESDTNRRTSELTVVRKDGSKIPCEIHVTPLPSIGTSEYRGNVGVIRDISDRKARERQLRKQRDTLEQQNDRLNKFASVVGHDLRNPLNVAEGRLELARSECDSDHLDSAADAVARGLTLLEDLLTLAREGETVSAVESLDLATSVDRAWQTVQTADATLVSETAQTIQADESRLMQLLENLFRNAVEHAGPEVTVTVGELETGFFVTDDGPGIDAAARPDVFETGYSTADEGTGFGLPIVEEIVDAHGWDIAISESSSGGVRFEITGVEITAAH
jgi:PAS domain S-box-containing protein